MNSLTAQKSYITDLILKKFPNLAEPKLQEEIAENGKIMYFRQGETIMDIGNYVKFVPLVTKGSIKVSREDSEGREVFLYFLEAGTTCAASFTCCMMHKKSEFRTVAEEDTEVIAIPIQIMDSWISKYQSWKNFVLTTYQDRFDELIMTLESIAFKKMDERLLDYLYDKSKTTKSDVIVSTHQEIATDLNGSREAISRLLKQLENEGMVKLGRNKIELVRIK
jgi:CRP/FNR family transcriptional regulator